MPPDEGDALHAAALAAAAAVAGRADRRDRLLLRPLDDLAGSCRCERRHRRVRRRPPSGFGGEPAGVGVARPDRRRSAHRQDGHAAVLPGRGPRRRPRGARHRRRRALAGRRPLLVDAGGDGLHRRRPRRRAGAPRTTRGGPATSPSAARWPSTTSSRTRPTAAARRTSRSSCPRWPAVASAWLRRPARCACSPASTDPRRPADSRSAGRRVGGLGRQAASSASSRRPARARLTSRRAASDVMPSCSPTSRKLRTSPSSSPKRASTA